MALECEEALYGGAAGGGKSDALLMAALQYVHVPGYAALIVRKTYKQLSRANAIMARAQHWLAGTDARWIGDEHAFVFPSGARLEFGHLQHSKDRLNYQGAEYHFIAFDELTQFEQEDYLYLHSRLRRPEIGASSRIPLRVRGASNPGGIGHDWVRSRFILREPQNQEDDAPPDDERLFIPAKIADNPSLNRESYERQLANLDSRTRAQLLEGRWDVREPGACFPEFKWEEHTIDGTRPLSSHYDVVRAIDWGHHHMPVLWLEVQGGAVFVFDEWHGRLVTVPDAAEAIKLTDADHALTSAETLTYFDPAGLGTNLTTGKSEAETLEAQGVAMAYQDERYSPETRCSLIKTMLEQGRLWISRDRCPDLIRSLERATWDRVGVDGAMKDTYKKDGKYDHHLDALGEALVRLFPPYAPGAVETEAAGIGPWSPGYYSGSPYG